MPGAVNVKIAWTRPGGGAAPAITSPAFLDTGTVDTLYPTTTFTATGTAPITWSIASGTLPAGMTFVGGVLAGTPTATFSGSITFRATNAFGFADRPLTLTVNAAGSLPLLYEANVTGSGRYLGAFRVPEALGASPLNWSGSSGASGGRAVWYKPEGNSGAGSLIISGRDVGTNQGYLSEISIPATLDTTGVVGNMNRGAFLTPSPYFFDISNGNQQQIDPSDVNGIQTCGAFTYDGNLYQNFKAFYLNGSVATYFKRTGTSVNGGSVSGPFRFDNQTFAGNTLTPSWYTGPVCSVPSYWQSSLGGVMLQGNWQMSNPEPQGNGPFIASFDPNNIGATPAANNILLGYDTTHPLSTSASCVTSDWQRSVDAVSGMVFPSGTRTVLAVGTHGLGIRQYGTTGQIDESGCGLVIVDPVNPDKGWHAYPYKYTVWAYDANDLLDVKNGVKQPYQVTPYSTWNITFPGQDPDSTNVSRCSACFDAASSRLFFVERESPRCQTIAEPIIHVFQLSF